MNVQNVPNNHSLQICCLAAVSLPFPSLIASLVIPTTDDDNCMIYNEECMSLHLKHGQVFSLCKQKTKDIEADHPSCN